MATQSSSNPTGDQTPSSNAEPAAAKPTASSTAAEQPVVSTSSSTTAEQPTVKPEATTTAEPTVAQLATAEPTSPVQPTVVFVTAPQPPKNRGARGVGALVALLGAGLFAAAYALLIAAIAAPAGLVSALQFLSSVAFYLPVIIFFLSYLLLIVIVNRAGWWAHVLGGFAVAVIVWVGFVGAAIIAAGVLGGSSAEVGAVVLQQLANPLGFAAAIAAREVPIWVGGLVAKRGRTAHTRNVEANAAYAQEVADHRATLGSNTPV